MEFSIFSRKVSLGESGLPGEMEDRHSHILYGVDDGAGTEEDSLSLVHWLEARGLKELWLTPHVMEDIPNTSEGLRKRYEALAGVCGGNMHIHLASEYMLDTLFESRLEDGDLLCMENNMVLVETSTWSSPYNLTDIFSRIMKSGYWPLLAHPERYRYMETEDYVRIADMGVRFQMNLPSIAGLYGETEKKKAEWLLREGMYSFIGSDCHNLRMLDRTYSAKTVSVKDIDRILKIKDTHK